LQATFSDGSIVDLGVNGITAFAVTNATISTDQTALTTVSLSIIGQNSANNVDIITVPKTAVAYSVTPKIYVNNLVALDQGFSQDANNYYVWYKTVYSTYELSIVFTTNVSSVEFPLWIILFVIIIFFPLTVAALAFSKKEKSLEEYSENSTYC